MKNEINARYLPGGLLAAHEDDSSITPLVDGEEYFAAARMEMGRTEAGDAIYLLGWRFESNFRFSGQSNDIAELGPVLAEKVTKGVDVRLIMPVKWQLLYLLEKDKEEDLRKGGSFDLKNQLDRFGPHGNILHARLFREINSGGVLAPLKGRIALDYSGEVTGIHHQKMVLVIRGGAAVGFVAGIDFLQDRLDTSHHDAGLPRANPARIVDSQTQSKSFGYYWHDAGVRVEGPAVQDLMFLFQARWDVLSTLRNRSFKLADGLEIPSLNPQLDATSLRQIRTTPVTGNRLTGVLVSLNVPDYDVGGENPLFHDKNPLLKMFPFKERPVHSTGDLYGKAIAAAQKYIYVEDQYFGAPVLHDLLKRAAQRGVKIIAVLGGYDDDTAKAVPPRATGAALQLIKEMGKDSANLAIAHVTDTIIHSKIMIVDDEFAVIGSTNFANRSLAESEDNSELAGLLKAAGQSRSTDSELSVGAVDGRKDSSNFAFQLRLRLWSEHLRVDQWDVTVRQELADLSVGVSVFKKPWGKPVSFSTSNSRVVQVPFD
jgi:phosphatidylserine/phosphatidylglycerophosphate/cardiolipin synthase-like enzyme